MNKKLVVAGLGVFLLGTTAANAQKAKIREANKELDAATIAIASNDKAKMKDAYLKAAAAAEAATQDPTTASSAAAWFAKAAALVGSMQVVELAQERPYLEGAKAFAKALELDPKIVDKEAGAENIILNLGYYNYNDGNRSFNQQKFDESYEHFQNTVNYLAGNNAKRFKGRLEIDTIVANANLFSGYSAFYAGKTEEGINLISKAIENPINANSADVYNVLAEAYAKKGDKANEIKTIEAGRKKFPADKNLAASELNYHLSNSDQKVVVAKFEEEVAKDPSNPQYQFNLGILYDRLAKNDKGEYVNDEYKAKAAAAYNKAIELSPENPVFSFNYGVSLFNEGVSYHNQLIDLGISKEDQAKSVKFTKLRDGLFENALVSLNKAKGQFEKNKAKLTGNEMKNYYSTLEALSKIYSIQGKTDKSKEIKAIMNEMTK